MSKQKPLIPTGFDPRLLARMTGMLGDTQTLERLCGDLGLALAELLPGAFHNETGLDITFAYAGFDAGLKNDLIHDFGDGVVLTDGSLKNWCDDLSISCDSPVIITLMETLLGAVAQSIEEPEPRNLSAIELDIAAMVFEKIGGIVASCVSAGTNGQPVLVRPYNAEDRAKPDPDVPDVYAVAVNMTIGLGPVLSTFSVVVPQKTLLKTRVVVSRPQKGGKGDSTWAEQLREQVQRSHVTLEARIRLENLTLNTISRLQPGDVIPFHDATDVRVDVSGNGHELYQCEFGRAGARYTVRVKDVHGSEADILDHLMG